MLYTRPTSKPSAKGSDIVSGNLSCCVRRLGRVDYAATQERMQAFTLARTPDTIDEIWLLEHPPIYTLGIRAKHRQPRLPQDIAVAHTDRGGDVTYHGPGQPVLYCLIDLARRGLGIHMLVQQLEQAVIETLRELGIAGARRVGAPGVYVDERKIASLGLRVRGGRSYHGLALNADMDLMPFRLIDPCGYPGLTMTHVAEWRPGVAAPEVGERLLRQALALLGYTENSAFPVSADVTSSEHARF
jgi:lipoyl(octanoyl) transferase